MSSGVVLAGWYQNRHPLQVSRRPRESGDPVAFIQKTLDSLPAFAGMTALASRPHSSNQNRDRQTTAMSTHALVASLGIEAAHSGLQTRKAEQRIELRRRLADALSDFAHRRQQHVD